MVGELGEVVWVVDLNRQSLDRVVPILGATRLQGMFAAAGWQVLTVKYGHLLQELFTRPGGAALRARIDEMSNPEYQRLLRCTDAQLRERLPGEARDRRGPARARRHPGRRHPARRDPQPRRPRPRRPGRGVHRDRRHPADRDLRLHRQGARAGHRGAPAEPLVAAHDGAVRPARRAARHRPRRPVGAVPGRLAPRPRCAPRPPRRLRRDPVAGRRAARGAGRLRPHPVAAPPPPRPRSAARCSTSPGRRPRPRPGS